MAPEAAGEGRIGDTVDGEVTARSGIPDLGGGVGVGFGAEAGVGRWLEGSGWRRGVARDGGQSCPWRQTAASHHRA